MATLDAIGKELKGLTPVTTLEADGTAMIALTGNAEYHPKLLLNRTDVASVLKGLSKPEPKPTIDVGLIGLCGRYTGSSLAQQHTMTTATGIVRDRIDIRFGSTGEATTAEELALLTEYAQRGVGLLPIYDPQPEKTSGAAQVEADMKTWAPTLKACGITVVECLNEPYFQGVQPTGYAAIYAAMVKGLAGSGVNVLAKGWGDYYTGTEWSQCAAGRGWCVDFCKALGSVPWAWGEHYYGPSSATGVLGGGAPSGWGSIKAMQEYRAAHGLTAPLYITETGVTTPAEATEVEQALELASRITEAAELGGKGVYLFCAIGTEYGLWNQEPFTARPAVAAVAQAVAGLA